MRIALTGFGPFGTDRYNPTEAVTEALLQQDGSLVGRIFEVSRESVDRDLEPWLDAVQPDVVLSLGLAGGRAALAIEAFAVNRQEFRIPDVQGLQPAPGPIDMGGPAAWASGVAVDPVQKIWEQHLIPGYISYSAGTYLCNYLFYRTSRWAYTKGGRAAFVHVPYSTRYVPHPERHPSMDERLMADAMVLIIEALQRQDI